MKDIKMYRPFCYNCQFSDSHFQKCPICDSKYDKMEYTDFKKIFLDRNKYPLSILDYLSLRSLNGNILTFDVYAGQLVISLLDTHIHRILLHDNMMAFNINNLQYYLKCTKGPYLKNQTALINFCLKYPTYSELKDYLDKQDQYTPYYYNSDRQVCKVNNFVRNNMGLPSLKD